MNLAKNLERSAFFFPERPAVSEAPGAMTYAQLNEKAYMRKPFQPPDDF